MRRHFAVLAMASMLGIAGPVYAGPVQLSNQQLDQVTAAGNVAIVVQIGKVNRHVIRQFPFGIRHVIVRHRR